MNKINEEKNISPKQEYNIPFEKYNLMMKKDNVFIFHAKKFLKTVYKC